MPVAPWALSRCLHLATRRCARSICGWLKRRLLLTLPLLACILSLASVRERARSCATWRQRPRGRPCFSQWARRQGGAPTLALAQGTFSPTTPRKAAPPGSTPRRSSSKQALAQALPQGSVESRIKGCELLVCELMPVRVQWQCLLVASISASMLAPALVFAVSISVRA